MAEVTVPMDDKALFEAATAIEAPAETPVQQSVADLSGEEQLRDEHGRFAAKAAEQPEQSQTTEPQMQQPPAQSPQDAIPPWRLREEADARRQAEQRAAQAESQARQFSEQLRQFTEKKAEPIDPLMDFGGAFKQHASELVSPINRQIDGMRQFFSQQFATQQYGNDAVKAAYDALGAAMQKGDRNAVTTYERMMGSMHPFGDMVAWHKRETTLSTIGDDPNKWFDQEFERRMTADPQFAAKARTFQPQQPAPSAQPTNVVKLPPSLSKAAGGSTAEPVGSMADADLYSFAIGRT